MLALVKFRSASIFPIDLRDEGSPVLRHRYRFTRSNEAAKKPALLVSSSAQVAPCVPLRNRGLEFSLSLSLCAYATTASLLEVCNFGKCCVQRPTVCCTQLSFSPKRDTKRETITFCLILSTNLWKIVFFRGKRRLGSG